MTVTILWIVLVVAIDFSNSESIQDRTLKLANIPEDGRLQFCELAKKYGYECIRHNVTTNDGYILGLFNIPGDKRRPVFLQHGIVDSSDTFLIRTNTSLVAFLAEQGYDIWLGNMRGNKYSRAHKTLDPNGIKFWDFSFHEIAIYDVPAMIDYVLNKTGQNQLQAIAHSQGTTLFFAMGASRPEYNDKVKVLLCLAPIVYLQNAEPLLPLGVPIGGSGLLRLLTALPPGELLANSSEITALTRVVCTQGLISYAFCIEAVAFNLFGRDTQQLEPEFTPIVFGHYPSGTSMKNGIHLLQLASRKQFAQYDYGYVKNLQKYNRTKPPVYDLSKVTMSVSLAVGKSDKVTNMKDVQKLKKQLSNVVDLFIVKRKEWNHSDFVWAKDMAIYLFGYIKNTLHKYSITGTE